MTYEPRRAFSHDNTILFLTHTHNIFDNYCDIIIFPFPPKRQAYVSGFRVRSTPAQSFPTITNNVIAIVVQCVWLVVVCPPPPFLFRWYWLPSLRRFDVPLIPPVRPNCRSVDCCSSKWFVLIKYGGGTLIFAYKVSRSTLIFTFLLAFRLHVNIIIRYYPVPFSSVRKYILCDIDDNNYSITMFAIIGNSAMGEQFLSAVTFADTEIRFIPIRL